MEEEAPRERAPTHTTVKMGAASRLQAFADEDEDEDEPLNLAQVSLVSCPPSRVRALDSDFAPASVRLQVTVRLQLTVRLQVWCQAHP